MINKDLVKKHCPYLSDTQLDMLDIYAEELVQWNKKMNLTAITQPDEIAIKHFIDCLMLLEHAELRENARVIDVGTGAGFPAMVLKIARNDLDFTLVDALNKRLVFLQEVLQKTGLDAQLVHARAEDLGKEPEYREAFDYSVARAVAPMNVLCEYCLPFVKVGGELVALKGSNDDVTPAMAAIEELGGELKANVSYKLPNGDSRSIVIIKKISHTPTKYPRKTKKITSCPL